MPTHLTPNTVCERFFKPVLNLLPDCKAARSCPALPDSHWLQLCLARVLHDCSSGRAFLQEYGSRFPQCPQVGAFFESLKSQRRERLVQELNQRLLIPLARSTQDLLAAYSALQDFEVYAGDGHWHAAAAHDPVVDGTKYATGHFYGLNLRTHALVHLTTADQEACLKEHDMRALKRLAIQTLRQQAPKGRKVLWVWDKAGINFQQWHQWKQGSGVYFLSCAKDNMKPEILAQNPFDFRAAINQGVLADDLVGTSQQVMVRQVTYRDPVSGERFRFLTNELTLPPGLIAHLYRLRWNIEKVFDELKNKLAERKAWATSPTAKTIQGQLLCLMHNLLGLFEATVLGPAAIQNQAEDRRRQQRLREVKAVLRKKGQTLPRLVETLQRCTQCSVKFIRWLRSYFFSPSSCSQALVALRALYAKL